MGGGGGGGSGATAMADGGGATGGGVGVGAGVVAAVAVGVTDGGGGGGEDPHATRNTSPMDAKTEEQTYVRIMSVVYIHPPADVHKEMHAQCVRAIL